MSDTPVPSPPEPVEAAERCPKCNSEQDRNESYPAWFCGSVDYGNGAFKRSNICRIRELEKQLAAVTEERDRTTERLDTEKRYHASVCGSIRGELHAWFCVSQITNECNCGMQIVADRDAAASRAERSEAELARAKRFIEAYDLDYEALVVRGEQCARDVAIERAEQTEADNARLRERVAKLEAALRTVHPFIARMVPPHWFGQCNSDEIGHQIVFKCDWNQIIEALGGS